MIVNATVTEAAVVTAIRELAENMVIATVAESEAKTESVVTEARKE